MTTIVFLVFCPLDFQPDEPPKTWFRVLGRWFLFAPKAPAGFIGFGVRLRAWVSDWVGGC